jgi:hypothetical protein
MRVNIGPYPKESEERLISIQIDPWDTWNMDSTLAMIILPMLKQIKETKHGSPLIDNEDLPEEMRITGPDTLDAQLYFDFEDDYEKLHWDQYEIRWNWVLDEMIWAFEQKNTDWEDQYLTAAKVDGEGWSKHSARMQNGFRLFGKYFESLWD